MDTADRGVWRTAELLADRMSHRDIAHSVASGRLLRLRKGVYARPSADPDVVIAAGHNAAVCCASALRKHGVWVLEDEPKLHVWLGANGKDPLRHEDGCTCLRHWDGPGAAFGVVPVVHALVQSAECLGQEGFFAALESAMQKQLLRYRDVREIRRRVSARHRWLVDLARWDAESGLESVVRLRLVRLGLRVACQVRIRGVGRVDFVLNGRLIIEIDGRENHDGPSSRHKDLRRDAVSAGLGFLTLRFDYALVMHEWTVVESAILAVLSRVTGR
ncbi:DUF559 domain-containing protein [Microbacterium rhizophilus]|uniref:DUF559 domain-containing protein n=1 Tax=Microbacterium rhizophilus TaxID=3138934 RepID=UPI0031EE2AEE